MNNYKTFSLNNATLALRKIYTSYGYIPYKMGRFEEYDFYVTNKDFLTCDSIITFNDSRGRLMALKPDVTLSIVKGYRDNDKYIHRVCYNESVYRISSATKDFKEMMQSGVECIGKLTVLEIAEIIELAAKSLDTITDKYSIEISHMGLIDSILNEVGGSDIFRREALKFIGAKSLHDIRSLCNEHLIPTELCEKLCALIEVFGERGIVLSRFSSICTTEAQFAALSELTQLSEILDGLPCSEYIKFDLSVINDMKYYNGFVFNGYVEGINEAILLGGQYDGLMKKFGKKSGAVGFAIYPDLIEQLNYRYAEHSYDFDILLVYPENVNVQRLLDKARTLRLCGKSVSMQRNECSALKYKSVIYLNEEGEEIENDC